MNEDVKGVEKLSVRAVGSNVLLKGTFFHSPLSIQKKEPPKDAQFSWEIASIGKLVESDFKVGDFAILHSAPNIKCYVPENKAALHVIHEGLMRLPDEDYTRITKDHPRVIVVEYFIVPEAYIIGITTNVHKDAITKELTDLIDYIYDSYKNNPEVIGGKKSNLILSR